MYLYENFYRVSKIKEYIGVNTFVDLQWLIYFYLMRCIKNNIGTGYIIEYCSYMARLSNSLELFFFVPTTRTVILVQLF